MGRSKPSRSRESDAEDGENEISKQRGNGERLSIPCVDIEPFLDELLNKKGPKREKAMESIADALSNLTYKSGVNFLENNFATFLYRSLNLFKKGSVKELQSSSQSIGTLAMIIDDEDDANEIFREVFPIASKTLKSQPKTLKVFDCLAMSAFFGASNSEETQAAMQMILPFICPESESGVSTGKHSPEILVAAISAWLFLLSSLERWGISSQYWHGTIPYFLSLLGNGDQSVSVEAGYALALIFEMECIDKFVSRDENNSGETSSSNTYSIVKEAVKDSILEKLEEQISANNVTKEQLRVLDYLKSGCFTKVSTSIGKGTIVLSSWSKIIQLNYLKSFLGNRGLKAHMMGNQKLQALFGFSENKVPRKELILYEPTVEEVTVNCYLPKDRDFSALQNKDRKKDKHMRSAVIDKAQTKLRSKKREWATERKLTYGFDY